MHYSFKPKKGNIPIFLFSRYFSKRYYNIMQIKEKTFFYANHSVTSRNTTQKSNSGQFLKGKSRFSLLGRRKVKMVLDRSLLAGKIKTQSFFPPQNYLMSATIYMDMTDWVLPFKGTFVNRACKDLLFTNAEFIAMRKRKRKREAG